MNSKRQPMTHGCSNTLPRLAGMAMLAGALVIGGGVYAQSDAYEPDIIVVQDFGSMVTFGGGSAKAGGHLTVSIDGPDGKSVFEGMSKHGLVDWNLSSNLPDGNYRYDVWFVSASSKTDQSAGTPEEIAIKAANAASAEVRPVYRSGQFTIQGGFIESHSESPSAQKLDLSAVKEPPSRLERVVGSVLELIVPAAHAGVVHGTDDVTIDGSFPAIFFDDTGLAGAPNLQLLADQNGYSFATPIVTPFFIDIGAPGNALYIENTGDIGVGTNTPATKLELVDTFANISFVDSDNSNYDYELLNNGGIFFLIDRTTGAIPMNVQNNTSGFALTVNNNNVGVGNFVSPSKLLHVRGSDASALTNNNVQLRVENTSGTVERRDLLTLSNNGGVKFTMEDRDRGDIWDFSTRSNGFNINLLGTGGQELLITPLGEFRVGPGGVQNFVVKPNGDVFVDGSLVHSSSRETKEQISPVDGNTVLAKLERLEVAEWSYKDAVDGERHLSPMAEEFHGLFGLGPDNKHVSPSDLAGVALAAAKALNIETNQLKAEKESLKSENQDLRARLERIESRLGLSEE